MNKVHYNKTGMKKITKLWTSIITELTEAQNNTVLLEELSEKFSEIFDLKEVNEYKQSATVEPFYTPSQFTHFSAALRRALVEGYLLAQAERKKEDIALLQSCYNKSKGNKDEKNSSKHSTDTGDTTNSKRK